MKIKDVCEQTGLTDRTVRFYVEKGLIKTQANVSNGRINREYSEENVDELKGISKLRQAGFSIQDIIEMQNSENNVSDIILKHYNLLEEEQKRKEDIINELKAIHKRGNMSWRKLADLLYQTNEKNIYDLRFAQFDEVIIEEERKNSKIKIFLSVLVVSVLIILLVLNSVRKILDERPLVTIFTISEVTFHTKWIDGGRFVRISTNPDAAVGYDSYFFEPQTIALETEDHYEAIMLKSAPYMGVSIRIEIPYGQAKKYKLIDSQQNIVIEKVLEKENFILNYCTVERIY